MATSQVTGAPLLRVLIVPKAQVPLPRTTPNTLPQFPQPGVLRWHSGHPGVHWPRQGQWVPGKVRVCPWERLAWTAVGPVGRARTGLVPRGFEHGAWSCCSSVCPCPCVCVSVCPCIHLSLTSMSTYPCVHLSLHPGTCTSIHPSAEFWSTHPMSMHQRVSDCPCTPMLLHPRAHMPMSPGSSSSLHLCLHAFLHQCIPVPTCDSTQLSICVHASMCVCIHALLHLCIHLPQYLCVGLSLHQQMYPHIPASLYPHIHVSLCLCIHVHNAPRCPCIHTSVPMDLTFHMSIPVPMDLYPCVPTLLYPYGHAALCPYLPCILHLGQDVTMQEVLAAASPRLWLAHDVPGSPQTTLSQPRSGISIQSRMRPLGMLGMAAKTKKGGNNCSVNRWKSPG